MSRSLESLEYTTVQATQTSLPQGAALTPAAAEKVGGTPRAFIAGDLHLYVSESAVATRPIRGSYWIETEEIQEPLQVIWSAEGRVLTDKATSTTIEFDMPGAKTGQMWTYVVMVQVTGSDGHCCIVSGVFVQILVT